MIVPLRVLGDSGAQEPERLHCSPRDVQGGEWGESGGFLLKSTIIFTVLSVLSSRLLRLHQTASSLTSCLVLCLYRLTLNVAYSQRTNLNK